MDQSDIDQPTESSGALRSRRAANWIIVLGLLVALWTPLLYALSAVPQFKLSTLTQIGDAFEGQFPFRVSWRRQYNAVRYWLLRALPVQVVKGKDGWLFYRAEAVHDGHVFDDFLGEVSPSNELIKAWCESLQKRRSWLSGRGIASVFIVVPNKETVYADKLPDELILKRGRTSLDALSDACGDEFIDLRSSLAEARRSHNVYYPRGTHWTSHGAYVGYRAILKELNLEPMPITAFREVQLTIDDSWLMLFGIHSEPSPELDPLEPHLACHKADGECRQVLYPNGPADFSTDPRGSIVVQPDLTLPTAVVFHDSFKLWLASYLGQHFRMTVFVPGPYQAAVVEQYKPDVVIIETVERYMPFKVETP